MAGDLDPGYILARRVLLDALAALAEHRDAVVLVGAQAIYLHTGEGELATQVFTTDADLALNPTVLGSHPLLAELLGEAGFQPSSTNGAIGTWISPDGIPVDLMVPVGAAPPGSRSRSAALGTHGNRAARIARGLEAVLIDWQEMTLAALDPTDSRVLLVKVAGPSALLVAKLHKLADRRGNARRQDDKDALDVYRLLVATSTETLIVGIRMLLTTAISQEVTRQALDHLADLFGTHGATGSAMAGRAVEGLDDPETIAASCAALAQDLLAALQAEGA